MRVFSITIILALTALPTNAQMSVSTLGATDAAACYRNANDQFSHDTEPCDRALRDRTTTREDRLKTYVNRGIINNRIGALQTAVDDFNAALEIDDTSAEAFLNRGNSWFRAGQYGDALADYEHALHLDVNKPWAAWYNIGLVHDAQGDNEKALQAYQAALELNPDFALAANKIKQKQQENRQ